MLNTLIIEDEKPAARRLQRMIEKKRIKVITVLHSVNGAINWLQNNPHPDLIFVDIQLSDGLSFEIFEKIAVESSLIFTTAYNQYAIKAFKVNSVDYLLKPVDANELEAALEKFQRFHKKNPLDLDAIKTLIHNKSASNYKQRFTVQIGQHLKIIETKSIFCFYSEDKATYAYNDSGKSFLLEESLENILSQLDPDQFFRVSRSFIINISAIQDIISYTNSRLEIKLHHFINREIVVSRERVKAFKAWVSR